jgi:hypothetical protein
MRAAPPRGPRPPRALAELGGQADVAQHQTRLPSQVGEEPLFQRRQRVSRPLEQADATEHLRTVADVVRPDARPRERHPVAVRWPRRRERLVGATTQPDLRLDRACALGDEVAHPREHVVVAYARVDACGEARQDVVRRRRERALQPATDRLEPERDQGRRDDREAAVRRVRTTDQDPAAEDDDDVDGDDEDRHAAAPSTSARRPRRRSARRTRSGMSPAARTRTRTGVLPHPVGVPARQRAGDDTRRP